MFDFPFMQNAYMAGTLIAIISGIMGVFVIARNMSFLTHTLSEIGFAGAAFGIFMGWQPLNGMLLFTTISSIGVGELGAKSSRRENVISAVSALAIGLGILFLSLANTNASYATGILFGSVIGISRIKVLQMMILSIGVLIILMVIYRFLKFDSFDPTGARVEGLWTKTLSVVFLILVAFSVSIAAQIVGSLLIFILLTLPAAAAKYFVHTVGKMALLAVVFSLVGLWIGLYLSYITNWPVSFFIAAIESGFYFVALTIDWIKH